jgi:hypothetical protein
MKHPRYEDYPPDITALSERVLLTAWPALAAYHDELVLVGGLVQRRPGGLPPPALPARGGHRWDVHHRGENRLADVQLLAD